MTKFSRICQFTGWFALLVFALHAQAADPATRQQLDFFERRIRPVLVEHCFECHVGGSDKQQKGGLNLSFRATVLQGGDSGPAIVPGKPSESLLLEALRYESLEMPPKGKLPARVIDDFANWIEMGAADPRVQPVVGQPSNANESTRIAADELWSLKPVEKVEPPPVDGLDHPIDRFVRARLLKEKIAPAPPATDRVLLRRLYLDLIGLPPTPEDLAAFDQAVATSRQSAIGAAVDRLLESPEFGERWARHWLDLTAYADTIGVGRAIPALEAWRYRDYVIAAFNTDKPFHEFVRQQIAGDITVPPGPRSPGGRPPTAESIIATGFLAIGPWELVGGDKEQLRMDVVDRQVHRIGQAFLALTFGCARCHDHKFDPVSQHDYYALAGLFTSSVTLNGRIGGVFSAINHRSLPETSEDLLARAERVRAYEAEVASAIAGRDAANAKVATLNEQIKSAPADSRPEMEKQRDAESARSRKHAARLNVLKYLKAYRTETRALAVADAPEPEACRINIRGNAHQLGDLVPRGFPQAIPPTDKPRFTRGGSGRAQLADWLVDKRNPLTARVWVNRIWHHLFGTGLVRTVDNFGARGEKPSHPELLDYLAEEFMRDGWSTKRLIRRILLSKTWQQSSTNHGASAHGAGQIDPGNRLLWRANRRRLEAEAIRDAMLAVSGQLNRQRGGPTLPIDHPGNLNTGLTGSLSPSAKFPVELKLRRSIYQPQKRKAPFDEIDFLAVFDLPDPSQESGRRTVTTVPTQALTLLNSPFVKECAAAIAKRTAEETADAPARISNIYLTVYGREPAGDELKETLKFVSSPQDDSGEGRATGIPEMEAWSQLCQSLLISNEFLFRD